MPLYPSIQRDIAFVAPKDVTNEQIVKVIKKLADKNILTDTKGVQSAIEDLSYTYSKDLSKVKSLLIFFCVIQLVSHIIQGGWEFTHLILSFDI